MDYIYNEQLRIKEFHQAMDAIETLKKQVEAGEILSVLVVCERTDGEMQGVTTATQNTFAVAGYMLTWALRRLGFTNFNDVRMMLHERNSE